MSSLPQDKETNILIINNDFNQLRYESICVYIIIILYKFFFVFYL